MKSEIAVTRFASVNTSSAAAAEIATVFSIGHQHRPDRGRPAVYMFSPSRNGLKVVYTPTERGAPSKR